MDAYASRRNLRRILYLLGLCAALSALALASLILGGCCLRRVPVGVGAINVQVQYEGEWQIEEPRKTPIGGTYFDGCNTWTRVGERTWNVTTLYCDESPFGVTSINPNALPNTVTP